MRTLVEKLNTQADKNATKVCHPSTARIKNMLTLQYVSRAYNTGNEEHYMDFVIMQSFL
jgi:hypothetical protein